ncbi:hypothetical protein BGZ76_008711 [Entomortierella beljakovae]|nr:hypothetical protein BGZ76_008711 [Entomortierella beljakovae]
MPSFRSTSSDRAAAAGLDINPCSNMSNSQRNDNTTTATSKANNINNSNNASATANHSTEAARMIAEANQQKNKLPTYPGLEQFTLIEKMGDGAFSHVYKAHDTKADRIVAIKVVRKTEVNTHQSKHLHRDMKKKPRMTERANILKEVQIMRQLEHPGIVELYHFSESDTHYFLVMELATGGELFHRIVKLTYFSEDLARHAIVQVAQAIRYLHEEKGVIHRDIKPENILFEPIPIIPSPPGFLPDGEEKEDEGIFQPGVGGGGIGRVKIADFGLSKIVWDEQTMTPCGTVGYTAPEIVKDERYSKSVDMWAMGCVLYTLLVGFPPFYDESIQALTEKVAKGQYTFLSPWWDEISHEGTMVQLRYRNRDTYIKDLITHLLCVNPNDRYTIDQFLAHPWIKAGETTLEKKAASSLEEEKYENKVLANVAAMTPEYGPRTPKTPYKRRAENPLSPGVGLKEVFDISNAVHRMEEESRRRHDLQSSGQPTDNQRQAFMTQLNELNEEDEEELSSNESGSPTASHGDKALTAGVNHVHINQSQTIPPQHIPSSATHAQKQQQAGAGGRSGNTNASNGRRRAGFELNMNNATLLKRRAKPIIEPGVFENSMLAQQSPAVAV